MGKLKADLKAVHEALSKLRSTNIVVLLMLFIFGFLVSASTNQPRYIAIYADCGNPLSGCYSQDPSKNVVRPALPEDYAPNGTPAFGPDVYVPPPPKNQNANNNQPDQNNQNPQPPQNNNQAGTCEIGKPYSYNSQYNPPCKCPPSSTYNLLSNPSAGNIMTTFECKASNQQNPNNNQNQQNPNINVMPNINPNPADQNQKDACYQTCVDGFKNYNGGMAMKPEVYCKMRCGSAVPAPQPTQAHAIANNCPQDIKICPDGSVVGRIKPNCEFSVCPGKENADTCPADLKFCPDGSRLSRTGPNCTFQDCPGEYHSVNTECMPAGKCWFGLGCPADSTCNGLVAGDCISNKCTQRVIAPVPDSQNASNSTSCEPQKILGINVPKIPWFSIGSKKCNN